MSASVQNMSRAPLTTPDIRESAAQDNDAQRAALAISGVTPASINSSSTSLNSPHVNGPDSVRTGLQIVPSPENAAVALQSSESQIARLQSNPAQPTARAASEAYLTQAASQTQVNLQPSQAGGPHGVNMMA